MKSQQHPQVHSCIMFPYFRVTQYMNEDSSNDRLWNKPIRVIERHDLSFVFTNVVEHLLVFILCCFGTHFSWDMIFSSICKSPQDVCHSNEFWLFPPRSYAQSLSYFLKDSFTSISEIWFQIFTLSS